MREFLEHVFSRFRAFDILCLGYLHHIPGMFRLYLISRKTVWNDCMCRSLVSSLFGNDFTLLCRASSLHYFQNLHDGLLIPGRNFVVTKPLLVRVLVLRVANFWTVEQSSKDKAQQSPYHASPSRGEVAS